MMAAWIQKSPGCELSVFLSSSSSSPPTTSFFTDSSLSYRHQALHFLSSHYKVSPCSFLPFFTSFIITFQLFIFSFFIHVSPIHLRNKVWNLQVVYKGRCRIRLQTTDACREIMDQALRNEKSHSNILKYRCENYRWLLFRDLQTSNYSKNIWLLCWSLVTLRQLLFRLGINVTAHLFAWPCPFLLLGVMQKCVFNIQTGELNVDPLNFV
jgi:hypothetical protein